MDLNLNNQTVLITGSSRGIGFGIAEEFLKENARIILTGRSENSLKRSHLELLKLYDKDRVLKFNGDLFAVDILESLFEFIIDNTNDLDHIVCNIGSGKSVDPLKEDVGEFQRILEINLLNAVGIVNCLYPLLEKSISKDGSFPSITFISSICGIETIGCPVAYASAKSALTSYAKNISLPLGRKGIRVNTVTPGNIMFLGSTWERKIKEDKNKVDIMLKNEVPLQRFGGIEDIASTVVFLASEKAKFVNGANWVVDGGQTRS
tara:strand:+ start:1351 stop:2139 length:789 start_codon:yes stop_codon:yes gene_type:complete